MNPISIEELLNASADAATIGKVVNGGEGQSVTSRLGQTYPTLAEALRRIAVKALPIEQVVGKKSQLPAPASAALVAVVDDTAENNGVYMVDGGSWVKTSFPLGSEPANAKAAVRVLSGLRAFWDAGTRTFHLPEGTIARVGDGVNAVIPRKDRSIAIQSNGLTAVTINTATGTLSQWPWGSTDYQKTDAEAVVAIVYGSAVFSDFGVDVEPVGLPLLGGDNLYVHSPAYSVSSHAAGGQRSVKITGKGSVFAGFRSVPSGEGSTLVIRAKVSKEAAQYQSFTYNTGGYVSLPAGVAEQKENHTEVVWRVPVSSIQLELSVGVRGASGVTLSMWDVSYCFVADGAHSRTVPSWASVPVDRSASAAFVLARRERVIASAPPVQPLEKKFSLFMTYGQSLAKGNETWPRLSRVQKFGNMMLGNAPTAQGGGNDTEYNTFGAAVLKPLVAATTLGAASYTDDQVSAWTSVNQASGEPPSVGLVNHAKFLSSHLRDGSTFVSLNAAIGGKTIEQLSKTNTQDAFARYGGFVDGLRKATAAAGGEATCVALNWAQGEYNYYNVGGSWDYDTYLRLLRQLRSDMVADTMAITGQSMPPLFLTYQTGAQYARDVDSSGNEGLHVGEAQLQFALTEPTAVMSTPVYPFTDKGGHLDNNGSRWFGQMVAKVWHKVVERGEGWEPLHPVKTEFSGRELLVWFHVPAPPLRFADPYVRNALTAVADRGFAVTRNGTAVPIRSVHVVDSVGVRILLAEPLDGSEKVWYASQKTQGHGSLCDSDFSVGSDNYEYAPNTGALASANIAALVGKPYPLNNWSVSFCRPVSWEIEN